MNEWMRASYASGATNNQNLRKNASILAAEGKTNTINVYKILH